MVETLKPISYGPMPGAQRANAAAVSLATAPPALVPKAPALRFGDTFAAHTDHGPQHPLLTIAPGHQRLLEAIHDITQQVSREEIQAWDEGKQPPLKVLKAIVDSGLFVISVPLPNSADAQTHFFHLYNQPLRTVQVPQEKIEALRDMVTQFHGDHNGAVRHVVHQAGHAMAQALTAAELTKNTSVGVATFLGSAQALLPNPFPKSGPLAKRPFGSMP